MSKRAAKKSEATEVFTLCHVLGAGEKPTPVFAFHAKDEVDALSKALGWGRYHSFDRRDISVRAPTDNERANWMHDEYVN